MASETCPCVERASRLAGIDSSANPCTPCYFGQPTQFQACAPEKWNVCRRVNPERTLDFSRETNSVFPETRCPFRACHQLRRIREVRTCVSAFTFSAVEEETALDAREDPCLLAIRSFSAIFRRCETSRRAYRKRRFISGRCWKRVLLAVRSRIGSKGTRLGVFLAS